jgi:hypothetical protein
MQEQAEHGWARVWAVAKPDTDPKLRQGAWYPVVAAHRNHVALQVHGRRVTVRPVGTIYGVCPKSADRLELFENASVAECPRCGYRGEVAWWETG